MFGIYKSKIILVKHMGDERVTSGRLGGLVEAAVDFNRFLGAIVMVEVVATKPANYQGSAHAIRPE